MMLEGQNSLPRLPIASLDDAIEDFLRATEPLLSGPEFGRTKQLAQEFLENEGPALHKLLVEYDEHEGRNSFLEDFWEDAYEFYFCSGVGKRLKWKLVSATVFLVVWVLVAFPDVTVHVLDLLQ